MPILSFSDAVRRAALSDPERPAVTDADGVHSRTTVDRRIDRGAERLNAAGVRAGDVVAVTGSNSLGVLATLFATWRIGAIPMPMHQRRGPDETAALLELARPALAVGFEPAAGIPALSVEELTADRDDGHPPVVGTEPGPLRVATSGGSTGRSKLIVVESPAVLNPGRPWPYGMRSDGTHVVALDVVDGTGFTTSTAGLATGCHLVLMQGFDPRQMLTLLAAHRADWLALTAPLMLQTWKVGSAERARHDLSALRMVTHYAGPVAPWLKQAWIDWLGPDRLAESYGASDARGGTWIDGHEWLAHPGSVGKAARGCEITVLDEHHRPVPAGVRGLVHLRDLTGRRTFRHIGAQPLTLPGGWETVGDIGWLDEEGYLYLGDRLADVVHTAEGPVFPARVEGALEEHHAVRSAVVVGLPVANGGHDVPHAVVDAPYGPVDEAELRAWVAARLPTSHVPAAVEFCCGPLRDAAGKVRRARLRAERIGE